MGIMTPRTREAAEGAEPEDGTEPDARFTFANERTFLAWSRTALALVVAGLAIAGGEEACGDSHVLSDGTHVLDIDADGMIERDRDQSSIAGMRIIELHFRRVAEIGFAFFVERKIQACPGVSAEDGAQGAVGVQVAALAHRTGEAQGTRRFPGSGRRNIAVIETNPPDVDFVLLQNKRAHQDRSSASARSSRSRAEFR